MCRCERDIGTFRTWPQPVHAGRTPSWRSACPPVSVGHCVGSNTPRHSTPNTNYHHHIYTSAKNKMHFVLKSMKMRRKPWEGQRGCTRIHSCLCTYTCTCRILHTNVYGVLRSSTQEQGLWVGMKKTRRKKGPEDQVDEQNYKDKENQQDQESKYIIIYLIPNTFCLQLTSTYNHIWAITGWASCAW